jgi:hypothetical protein
MSINERRKYLQVIQSRYRRASRPGKSSLLDEAEQVTKLKRKSLIRLLNGDLERKERKRQRGRTYGVQVQRALMVLSESTDHICAERLQPNLVWLAKHLANHGELEVTPKLLEQLDQISVSTVRRIIRRTQQDQPRLPRPRLKPRNKVACQIPVKRISWDEREPGHFEVDLVHHSGSTAGGHYVHSLQMIDVATGWSERVATLGRSYLVIKDGFERILDRLPFPVLEIHSDNGSEFLNHHLIRFWEEEKKVTTLTRGRHHQKNDQRFVEQKNSTLIRQFFGYERFDTVAHTVFLNLLYRKMWLFYNFFQPVMRLVEKRMVDQKNGKQRLRRRHDLARTPYERLCETKILTSKRQQELNALREQTNPRQLRQEIYQMLDTLLSLPTATEDKTEDVYQTLRTVTGTEIEKGCGYVENSPQAPSFPHTHSLYYCHSEGRNTVEKAQSLKNPR